MTNPVNYYEYLENETCDEWGPYNNRNKFMPRITGDAMKPLIKEDQLAVELNKTEQKQLHAARTIGVVLSRLQQAEGTAIVEAVDAALAKFVRGE